MKTVGIFFEKHIGFSCLRILTTNFGNYKIFAFSTSKNLEHFPAAKDFCNRHNLSLQSIDNPNDPLFLADLKEKGIKLAFAVSYAKIFKSEIIKQLEDGIINLHPALLPKNGGCYPTMWSIIDGQSTTGYTLHRIETGIDTGPIIAQVSVPIEECDTGESLYAKQVFAGEKMFTEWAGKVIAGNYVAQRQIVAGSYHDKKIPFDGYLPWDKGFNTINKIVRAFKNSSYQGVLTKIDGRDVEVYNVELAQNISIPTIGESVVIDGRAYIRCKDGVVQVCFYEL